MTGRKRSVTRGRGGSGNKRALLLAAIYANLLLQAGAATASTAKALVDERGLILSDENGNALIAY